MNIDFLNNGEFASEEVLNRPLEQIKTAIDAIEVYDKVTGGGNITAPNVQIKDSGTYTLPICGDFDNGYKVTILLSSSDGALTPIINSSTGDILTYESGSDTSIQLDAGECLATFVSDSNNEWDVSILLANTVAETSEVVVSPNGVTQILAGDTFGKMSATRWFTTAEATTWLSAPVNMVGVDLNTVSSTSLADAYYFGKDDNFSVPSYIDGEGAERLFHAFYVADGIDAVDAIIFAIGNGSATINNLDYPAIFQTLTVEINGVEFILNRVDADKTKPLEYNSNSGFQWTWETGQQALIDAMLQAEDLGYDVTLTLTWD